MTTTDAGAGTGRGPELNPCALLLEQLQVAVDAGARAASGNRRGRLILLAGQPEGDAARARGAAFLRRHGLIVLGSRGGDAPSWYVAGTETEWAALEVTLRRRRAAQPVLGFAWPVPADVLPAHHVPGLPSGPTVWEVTLHGDADLAVRGEPVPPAGAGLIAAFTEAVTAVGGSLVRDPRATSSLTYLAVELPSAAAASELARFNGLRALRRPALISLRNG